MHRLLLFGNEKSDLLVDHKNHDTLDNRRSVNLRGVTNSQNQQNRASHQINNKCGVRGVHWNKRENKWIVQIFFGGKKKYIGSYKDLEIASEKAKEARITHKFMADI